MFILDSYIAVAIRYDDDTMSYISNTNPLIWNFNLEYAKKFPSVDDMYSNLGLDCELLIRYKNMFPNIKGVEILYVKGKTIVKKERFIS